MTEERKFAILFSATLVCGRKLMDMEDNARPAKICLVYTLFLDRGIDAPNSWA
jgi:hypothetical protein